MLDSGFYENQVWGAVLKAWKGYVIAKNKDEYDKMLHYADIIQECQYELGLEISSFPDIGKSASDFYSLRAAQIAEKNKSNSEHNHNQEQVAEEEEVDRHMNKKDSLMIMHIAKILQMIIINQIDLVHRVIRVC